MEITFGASFWLSFLFSLVGMGYFMYGKKASEMEFLFAGIGLMVYPYFVSSTAVMGLVGVGLAGAPFLLKRFS